MLVARLFGSLAVQDRPAARDGRGRGRHHARSDDPRLRSRPGLQATLFPTDILPAFGVAANLGLVFYMFLVGLELDPQQLKGRVTAGGGDLEHQRRAADDARHRRRAADLQAGRPRQEVRRVRAVHGRGDVDHRVPGARPHPRRAADAQAARGRAHARLRGDRRRDRVVPDRARDGGRGRRRRSATSSRRSRSRSRSALVMGLARAARCSGASRPRSTRRAACPAAGSRRSSRASCCPPSSTEEIGIAVIFGAFIMGMIMPRNARADRGRDAPDRGLRRRSCCCRCSSPTPACGRTSACSTGPILWWITLRPDRRGDRRQVLRRDDRRARRPASTGAPRR